jgi:hypothetical protein
LPFGRVALVVFGAESHKNRGGYDSDREVDDPGPGTMIRI